jgi:hypothetical protein
MPSRIIVHWPSSANSIRELIKKSVFYLLIGFCLLPTGNAFAAIMLKALVNDQPVRLLIDTRSGSTALFAHAAKRIGLEWTPPAQAPAPGRLAAGRSHVARFDTGSGPVPFVFNVADVPQYEQAGIDGVLSWTNLKGEILFLDGERRQFAAIAAIPEWAKDWPRYPIKTGTSGLVMQTGNSDILIDTVNDAGLVLGEQQWRKWTRQQAGAPYTLKAYRIPQKGPVVERVYHAERFTAGSFELGTILVERDSGSSAADYDLSLGLEALSRLLIIADIPNGVVYVKPSQTAPSPPDYNRLGAVFIPRNPDTAGMLTAVVADGSPAAQAGIRDGDALLRVDDLDVTQWRSQPGILPLGRFWAQPAGTRIPLEIQRNGKALQIEVTLGDFLNPG